MTTLLAGLGPAGRGFLSALHARGAAAHVCRDGLIVVEPSAAPGGGALGGYNVRSDSAAAVFASCVEEYADEPELVGSTALAETRALPDGESIRLAVVGQLLREATVPLIRRTRALGADIRLCSQLTHVDTRGRSHPMVTVSAPDGTADSFEVDRLVLAVGGAPHIPPEIHRVPMAALVHSDRLLRPAGLADTLRGLPVDPRIVIVGRAHSAFSVADRLLSSPQSADWPSGAVTVATRGAVRVTYPDASAAEADGAVFTESDICPSSGRVWRLCGLRGDAARRFRLGRDGADPRLQIRQVASSDLADLTVDADLVVAATGYRAASLDLVQDARVITEQAMLRSRDGDIVPRVWSLGLGSGSRREPGIGEPSYDGPVDGVWHYQHVVAPHLVDLMLTGVTSNEPS